MGVLPIISVMFAEILVVSVGLVAFFFLFREYLGRKKTFLLWGALCFLSFGAAFGALFFGQILMAYAPGPIPEQLAYLPNFCFPLASLFLLWFMVELYAGVDVRVWRGIAFTAVSLSLAAAWVAPRKIILINGLAVSEVDTRQMLMIFGSWFVSIIALFLMTRWSKRKAEKAGLPSQPDAALMRSGAFGILFLASSLSAAVFRLEVIFFLDPLWIVLFLAFLFLGAAAKDNPDPAIMHRPLNVFSRRLVLKAVLLNVVLFWATAFLLLAVTSNYFLDALSQSREISRRRDLHYLTKSYSSFSIALLEETARLADMSSVAKLITNRTADLPDEIKEHIDRSGQRRVLRIVDSKGNIVYSSRSAEEIGQSMLSSAVVAKALKGIKIAAVENETAFSSWMVRAAVPISNDDGGFVLLSTGLETVFDLADYSGIDATGYGFVSQAGDDVYNVGTPLDGVTKVQFRRTLNAANVSTGETDDGSFYNVERVFATDGSPDGFFYIFLDRNSVDREIVRILSAVMLLIIMSLIVITVILIFSISFVLRPIKELAAAAGEIEREKYDVTVRYASADELGALARAINRMAGTIGERTAHLKSALEIQRNFLAYTAHEMRTPLNIFRWTLELLRFGDVGRLTKEQMELLEQLHQTNERLVNMVDNLRIASRLEQSGVILKRSFFALEDLVDEAAGALSVKLREKNIALHWRRPDESLPKVFADRDRLMQVLLNLLSNAAKYTQRGGHVEVSLRAAEESGPGGGKGKFMLVTVEDNGMGIPKAEQDRVFSRFFRASSVQKTEIEGTGLGLFITKELVELHGGKIWFQSDEGTGSIFRFTIPVEKPYDSNRKTA